jgi:hypothetical protein
MFDCSTPSGYGFSKGPFLDLSNTQKLRQKISNPDKGKKSNKKNTHFLDEKTVTTTKSHVPIVGGNEK